MTDTKEKNLQICKVCEAHGYKVRRMNSGKVKVGKYFVNLGAKDWPDIFGFHRLTGRVIAIETKQPGERITEGQKAFLDDVEKAGGIALIAYTVEDVEHRLKQ